MTGTRLPNNSPAVGTAPVKVSGTHGRPAQAAQRAPAHSLARTASAQFILGAAVELEQRPVVRLTSRFRGRAIRFFIERLTEGAVSDWSRAPRAVRERVSGLAGKDASGAPLEGHRHAHYLLWSDDDRHYTRLLVWRPEPFAADEVEALLHAAEHPIGWSTSGPQPDRWQVQLVPLPPGTAAPPGLDGRPAREWRSVTPFVPPRHLFRRTGRLRPEEALDRQLVAELKARGCEVGFELIEEREMWVAVHQSRRSRVEKARPDDRRGYLLRLQFREPVSGPLILGHSATFGLGLLRPADPS